MSEPHRDRSEAEVADAPEVAEEGSGYGSRYDVRLSRTEKFFIATVCVIAVLALVMAVWDFSGL